MNRKLYGTTFCGNEASDYAKENGRLDYATLAKAFDAVLNNEIMNATCEIGYWEQENGIIDNSDEIDELNEKIDELNDKISDLEDEQEDLDDEDENYDAEYDRIENEISRIQTNIKELEDEIEELEREQDNNDEIFQYYIVSDEGARILKEWTNEIVFYNEALDMYIWGVTHWGTSWSYVLTDIKINCGEDAYN